MRKRALAILLFIAASVFPQDPSDKRRLAVKPESPIVGEKIVFTATGFHTPHFLIWDMGDGTTFTAGSAEAGPDSQVTLTHSYTSSGAYTVKVYDWNGDRQQPPVTIEIRILTAPPRTPAADEAAYLTVEPQNPCANQPVIITAFNFRTPDTVAWDLGDGSRRATTAVETAGGKAVLSHTYRQAGTYAILARDGGWSGTRAPVRLVLTVAPDPRAIKGEPLNPALGTPVRFTALRFNTPGNILWDMGDGETPFLGSAGVTHVFRREGIYTVNAFDWNGDRSRDPVTVTVIVSAEPDQEAGKHDETPAPTGVSPTPAAPTGASTGAPAVSRTESFSESEWPLMKLGPQCGFFHPDDAILKETYGPGMMTYGGRLGIHLWQGLYAWISFAKFRVAARPTSEEEQSALTLTTMSYSLRYTLGRGAVAPFVEAGFIHDRYKEENGALPVSNDSGSGQMGLAGVEFQPTANLHLDLGMRIDRCQVKTNDFSVKLGGWQAFCALLVSF